MQDNELNEDELSAAIDSEAAYERIDLDIEAELEEERKDGDN